MQSQHLAAITWWPNHKEFPSTGWYWRALLPRLGEGALKEVGFVGPSSIPTASGFQGPP